MGCTSSNLLNQEDDFTNIFNLSSTAYSLLTPNPSSSSSPTTQPPTQLIDSKPHTFSFAPQPSKPSSFRYTFLEKEPIFQENSNPNNNINNIIITNTPFQENINPDHKTPIFTKPIFPNAKSDDKNTIFIETPFQENPNPDVKNVKNVVLNKWGVSKPGFLDGFEEICPPEGGNKVVVYTTSLRGVRKTFEACNAVRAVLEGYGVLFCERDISMDRGFKDELWAIMEGKDKSEFVPPRVFVKGRYVGGADEVLRIAEEGRLGLLLQGLPKSKPGYVCESCGGARFLPCGGCNGSCKMVMDVEEEIDGDQMAETVTVKCSDCNENGLVRCPVCS